MKEQSIKKYPSVACCGLDCGLCPTYYTTGPSRCPGCCGPDFFSKHPSCSIITCCVKKKSLETCAECDEFPCSKIDKWDAADSFISHRVSLTNLKTIREGGIESFHHQQKKRIEILENLLENYNEGRSKSYYCIATALLPISDLEAALNASEQKIKNDKIDPKDKKAKANILKSHINDIANEKGIELKLRKK